MLTLPDHFFELLHRIEPNDVRKQNAQNLPAQIRNYLQKTPILRTVSPHSRLAGSYARQTAICDIKDVDIIVLVDPDYKEEDVAAVLNDLVAALQDLPAYLKDTGFINADLAFRRQRRSVQVHFNSLDFDADIVPAIAIAGIDKPLVVPDREWKRWVDSHPLGYGEYLSKLNCENGEKVVRLIKLLKHWRDAHMAYRRPKSYWLECLVVRSIEKGWIETKNKSYAELFVDLLTAIEVQFSPYLSDAGAVPKIPDPMLGNNVAWNWEREAFETFLRRIKESLGWAQRALNKDEGYMKDAIDLWAKVFNDNDEYFPIWLEDPAKQVASWLASGKSAYVASTGIVGTENKEHSIAPRPQRFYGKE